MHILSTGPLSAISRFSSKLNSQMRIPIALTLKNKNIFKSETCDFNQMLML